MRNLFLVFASALFCLGVTGCGELTVTMPSHEGGPITAHDLLNEYTMWEDCTITHKHSEGQTPLDGLEQVTSKPVREKLEQAAGVAMPWCLTQ